jgi:hypothetical protein
MKAIIVFAAALTVFAAPAFAKSAAQTASQSAMKTCSASWKAKSAADKKTTTHKAFMSSCMKSGGSTAAAAPAPASAMMAAPAKAHAPAKAPAPKKLAAKSSGAKSAIPTEGHTGTSARCKDGQVISIKSHAGACSHHGGVAAWL